jgi:hypothetical protein
VIILAKKNLSNMLDTIKKIGESALQNAKQVSKNTSKMVSDEYKLYKKVSSGNANDSELRNYNIYKKHMERQLSGFAPKLDEFYNSVLIPRIIGIPMFRALRSEKINIPILIFHRTDIRKIFQGIFLV